MNIEELKSQVEKAPLSDRAKLNEIMMYLTIGDNVKPQYAKALEDSSSYQDFLLEIYKNPDFKDTLEWAYIVKQNRRNWLPYFTPEMCIQNLRMKTDGLPIQMGDAVMLAPTGSRDNIANLYVFKNGAFNRQAADFVTSIGGKFRIADYVFFGIYGLYKYRGNVILEEWEVEEPPEYSPER